MNIPLSRPSIGDEELREIAIPMRSGWLVQGPQAERFEQAFVSCTGASHAVSVASGTAALHIAMTALGVRPGDEVIVPGFTWVATANTVEYFGAKPVFCDIDLRNFSMDPAQIEALITPRTVGIVPVHQFGASADMDAIMKIAHDRRLWVVEDAACALGTYYKGIHVGNFGKYGCFSFHPRKTVTTGEGGMLITADSSLAGLAVSMRNHGAVKSSHDRFVSPEKFRMSDHPHIGYNYRLSDIHASIGIVQMRRLPAMTERRRVLALRYDTLLSELPWLRIPQAPADTMHGYQSYVCLFAPENPDKKNVDRLSLLRNAIMTSLEEKGIFTSQGTHAPFMLGYYREKYGYDSHCCPQAYIAQELSMALPFFVDMTDEDQCAVATALKEAYATRVSD